MAKKLVFNGFAALHHAMSSNDPVTQELCSILGLSAKFGTLVQCSQLSGSYASSNGTAYTPDASVLSSDGTSYTLAASYLSSDGTSYGVA